MCPCVACCPSVSSSSSSQASPVGNLCTHPNGVEDGYQLAQIATSIRFPTAAYTGMVGTSPPFPAPSSTSRPSPELVCWSPYADCALPDRLVLRVSFLLPWQYNFFDPDNYLATAALLHSGQPFLQDQACHQPASHHTNPIHVPAVIYLFPVLLQISALSSAAPPPLKASPSPHITPIPRSSLPAQVRLVLERSGSFLSVSGQLPHHFKGSQPVYVAISGETMPGTTHHQPTHRHVIMGWQQQPRTHFSLPSNRPLLLLLVAPLSSQARTCSGC